MSVSDLAIKVREEGDGAEVDFEFSFQVSEATDVKAQKIVRATDAATELVYGADYTVALNANLLGGTVTYAVAPLATEDSLIYRETAIENAAVLPTNNIFREKQVSAIIDRAFLILQELKETVGRTVQVPITSSESEMTIEELLASVLAAQTAAESAQAAAEGAATSASASANDASVAAASMPTKASTVEAQAGTADDRYMTPVKVVSTIDQKRPIDYFEATQTGQLTLVNGVETVATFNAEVYDPNSWFASNKFTPQKAGKYLVMATVEWYSNIAGTNSPVFVRVRKNGATVLFFNSFQNVNAGVDNRYTSINSMGIIDLNGTTDYIELVLMREAGNGEPGPIRFFAVRIGDAL